MLLTVFCIYLARIWVETTLFCIASNGLFLIVQPLYRRSCYTIGTPRLFTYSKNTRGVQCHVIRDRINSVNCILGEKAAVGRRSGI